MNRVIRKILEHKQALRNLQGFLFVRQNLCHNIALLSRARVVKLVDAGDSKSPAARRAGSIPAPGTIGISYRPDSIARHQTYE
jgi:hypothetical protein